MKQTTNKTVDNKEMFTGIENILETALRNGIDFGIGCGGILTSTKENTWVENWLTKNKNQVAVLAEAKNMYEALKSVMNDLPFQPSQKTYDQIETILNRINNQ